MSPWDELKILPIADAEAIPHAAANAPAVNAPEIESVGEISIKEAEEAIIRPYKCIFGTERVAVERFKRSSDEECAGGPAQTKSAQAH